MKRICGFILIFVLPLLADSQFDHFISAKNGQLYDGNTIYRFISFNIPNLHYIEDNLAVKQSTPYRLPNDYEIRDELMSIQQMGGRVVRIYALPLKRQDEWGNRVVYINGPGDLNEQAFQVLDRVLYYANELGIRLIIPFIDNWSWWGGVTDYAAFYAKDKNAFWTDQQIKNDFKKTIWYLLQRKNVFTNTRYRDDKAILAWETGNELQCPHFWTFEMAQYIKSIDPNHLLIDGFHSNIIADSSLSNPYVDIITTHHYPESPEDMIKNVKHNLEKLRGIKPYFLGEFGFVDTYYLERLLDLVVHSKMSGALLWSLRFHNRDGGFYWHSEPFGGDRYKAYHWPGFASGQDYDETRVLNVMRRKAFYIQNKPVPALTPPNPPQLLPIHDVAAINWQGAAGATGYQVERADYMLDNWQVVGQSVSDAASPYQPIFQDVTAELDHTYYYRVIALNNAGASQPSNRVRSARVSALTLVDEFANADKMLTLTGGSEFVSNNARRTREDFNRLRAADGTRIVYKLPLNIKSFQLCAAFTDSLGPVYFSVSQNGQTYTRIKAYSEIADPKDKLYQSYKPVLFSQTRLPNYVRFLRIDCTNSVELMRLEIKYGH